MLAPPHPVVPGTNEKDYYLGKVTQSVPEQQQWVDEHTPDALGSTPEVHR